MKKVFITLVACAATLILNAQKYEGLADTPPMGWNSWNKFAGNINEGLVREIADKMVETGLRDAGYVYLNLDDCWHGPRDNDGFITADPKRFPSGIKALADYVHSKGLKLGIYSDAGRKTCAGRPGSFGHEYQDALQYARWGVDYLKYDWCESGDINPKGAYNLMRDALRAAGRPILFSMCEWGQSKPWLWAKETGHMWRTTGDIYNCFDCIDQHPGWKAYGVLQILDMQEGLRKYAGPGHWNDPDMLEVGNGQKQNEDRAHFSMWSMLAAPLILGNDLRNMSEETKSIIMNKEVIAVNQDRLGVQGFKFKKEDGLEFWFKPLEGGDWAFCILNRNKESRTYTINWMDFNLTDEEVSKLSTNFDTIDYRIFDLWQHKEVGTTRNQLKTKKAIEIPGHDVVMYELSAISR